MGRQQTQFSADSDWLFASSARIGPLPWSYDQVLHMFGDAGQSAGIGEVTTHVMGHSFRSWLDAFGTPLGLRGNCSGTATSAQRCAMEEPVSHRWHWRTAR
jgi:hypothetical protein